MEMHVIWVSLVVFQIVCGDDYLKPTKKCIPTDTIQGQCHVCVCHIDGTYHCRAVVCQDTSGELKPNLKECEPNQLYRQKNNFCSCSASGYWNSANCRGRFQRLLVKKDPIMKYLRTNIRCTPDGLYVTDCNVCQCTAAGIIKFSSCTTRPCPKRLKGDTCKPGDVYRSVKEFCMCSIVNYFIDRLCLKVTNDVVQPVSAKKLAQVIDPYSTYSAIRKFCEGNTTITIDCNTCICVKSHFFCTVRTCSDDGDLAMLRNSVVTQKKLALVELKSETQKCEPGMRYKLKCNTCTCNNVGEPICTSMLCFQDVVIDAKALKKMIISH